MTDTQALRQLYLDYFAGHGHTVVKSAPLVPLGDPTLMFVNAGMVPFKDIFVGAEHSDFRRAVSCQKCMRVSGKHNDLEEVGRTARHHTFFEMLGNFSFGDYFKEEAIVMAWDLVSKQLGLDKSRLWITVFGGAEGLQPDHEARRLWQRISGLPAERIVDKGLKDNFWQMGDTGPCGPCTEVHFDQGGDTPVCDADFDSGRVMEIWNNVFMQFERQKDGTLRTLPAPSVDTGMGLERVAALTQGADSNYHSDAFTPLLETIAELCGRPYGRSGSEDDVSMRVIADHARAMAFAVADGVQPSNEGRGYVLRRIMRRAIRHGRRLGLEDIFLPRVCDTVVAQMGAAYAELGEAKSLIEKVVAGEETGFRRTLDTGLKMLGDTVAALRTQGRAVLPGDTVFKLYDTYGFPKDLTDVLAQESGMQVDDAGFETAMEAQRARSRGGEVGSAAVHAVYKELLMSLGKTLFVGDRHEDEPLQDRPGTWRLRQAANQSFLETKVQVAAVLADHSVQPQVQAPSTATAAVELEVVLQPTPFYGESGGQAGDAGVIIGDSGDPTLAQVLSTHKPLDGLTVCRIKLLKGTLRPGDSVWAGYDPLLRKQTRAHHSATHLLHGALRQVLGDHVKQAGSFVDSEHLRFDYAHFSAPTAEQLQQTEAQANSRIAVDAAVSIAEVTYDAAKALGAIALFGEKYGDRVRVITMGHSIELCGGTHVRRTSELDMLLIVQEQAVQSGVRRIEACVGAAARRLSRRTAGLLTVAARLLGGEEFDWQAQCDDAGPEAQAALGGLHKAYALHQTLQQSQPTSETSAAPKPSATPKSSPAPKTHASSSAEPVFSAAKFGVTPPQLPPQFAYAQARQLLDTWQGLVQLVNGRLADSEAIVQRFGKDSPTLCAVAALLQANRRMERRAADSLRGSRASQATGLAEQVRTVGTVKIICSTLEGADAGELRDVADALRNHLGSVVVALAGVPAEAGAGKVSLLVAVTPDLVTRLRAGELIRQMAPFIGGRGGGKPELAQAGGTDAQGIAAAFAHLAQLVEKA
jgi:alanyl-tRNA synthetase